jgi:O-antigen biosynthesis protein WbqP
MGIFCGEKITKMLKRLADILLATIGLMVFFVPAIFIGILVCMSSKGPALYWSDRIGRNGIIFAMPKFRSMFLETPEVETDALLLPEKHITKLGKILRKSSLDEIPQIFSVLQGFMSFVGPRPALTNQLLLIEKRQKLGIDALRPGISGLAQVNGRDLITLDEKIQFDYEYLKSQSLALDLKIIFKTVWSVLNSKNIRF